MRPRSSEPRRSSASAAARPETPTGRSRRAEEASLYTGAMYRLKSRRLSAATRKRLLAAVGVGVPPRPCSACAGRSALTRELHPLQAEARRAGYYVFAIRLRAEMNPTRTSSLVSRPFAVGKARSPGNPRRLWHHAAMRDPRIEKLAELIAGYSLDLQEGQVYRIDGEDVSIPLAVALYAAAIRAARTRTPRSRRPGSRRSPSRRRPTSSSPTSPSSSRSPPSSWTRGRLSGEPSTRAR